jgi:uncharacterized protein Smg (DUF494 family)
MFYERVIEIIVYLLTELKGSKQLSEVDVQKLTKLGYTQNEINTAFSWVYSKIHSGEKIFSDSKATARSHRMLHEVEKNVIEPEAFGYLIQLRELGMVSDMDLEVVIDRIMASGYMKVNKEDIKYFLAGFLLDIEDAENKNKHIMLNINDTIN